MHIKPKFEDRTLPRRNLLILDFLPSDINAYINAERTNRFKASRIKKDDTEAVFWACKAQNIHPVQGVARIHFSWYVTNRKKDPDNIANKKPILDGMVKAGVLKSDGFNYISGFSDEFFLRDKEGVIVDIVVE